MRFLPAALLLTSLAFLPSCGHRSSAEVVPAGSSGMVTPPGQAQRPAGEILVTESDITDRRYRTLGDVTVSVSKNTIFDPDPTPELVKERLREEAAKLGADAVVLARYGGVGITLFSWGSMEGKGRAVAFAR